jgi:DNA modification methylase
MLELNKIHCFDVIEGLRQIPDNSIDCIVTSPPYWKLRDYGYSEQLGQEENPMRYVFNILEVMKECERIIRPTGTIWLNLGDSFYKSQKKTCGDFLKHKQKLLLPYRIAIYCQDHLGLILRNDIHWVKQFWNAKTKESLGNSMPCPAQDRLNTTSESIFFFVKSKKYYFDLDAVRIPYKKTTLKRTQYKSKIKYKLKSRGKNPGDCIRFPFEPSKEKHIAMFPKTIPEFCIKAGCPEGGIVLDPFMGSGTTAIVAQKLRRKFIGFDMNKDYIKIANRRIKNELSNSSAITI